MTGRPADVAIVGGGLIGCALARELAGRGASVVLIEKAHPGEEASSAAAGILAPQAEGLDRGPFFDLALESRGLYPRWVAELFEETQMDVGYRRAGILAARSPAAIRRSQPMTGSGRRGCRSSGETPPESRR